VSGASQGPLAVDLWNASEFLTWAGLRLTEAAGGRARLVLEVAPHHRGGAGGPAVNGGIIAYLFDAVCAAAVASTWDEGVTSQATIQLSVSYQRLLLVERRATAEAEVVQRGGSTVFVDARVMDESDRTCAVAHGIYHLFRRRGGDADAGTRADTRARWALQNAPGARTGPTGGTLPGSTATSGGGWPRIGRPSQRPPRWEAARLPSHRR
jgi:uncharacterized protein (TIGR00369 family)